MPRHHPRPPRCNKARATTGRSAGRPDTNTTKPSDRVLSWGAKTSPEGRFRHDNSPRCDDGCETQPPKRRIDARSHDFWPKRRNIETVFCLLYGRERRLEEPQAPSHRRNSDQPLQRTKAASSIRDMLGPALRSVPNWKPSPPQCHSRQASSLTIPHATTPAAQARGMPAKRSLNSTTRHPTGANWQKEYPFERGWPFQVAVRQPDLQARRGLGRSWLGNFSKNPGAAEAVTFTTDTARHEGQRDTRGSAAAPP